MNALFILNFSDEEFNTYSYKFYFNGPTVVKNILSKIKEYDIIFLINDSINSEANFLINLKISQEAKLYNKQYYFLNKTTFNPFINEHISKLLNNLKIEKYTLCGGLSHSDILSSYFYLLDTNKKVSFLPDCLGDIDQDFLNKSLSILYLYQKC